MKKQCIIPVFIPYLEKTDAVLYNQEEIYGQIDKVTKSQVSKIIEDGIKSGAKDESKRITFLGSNFTALDEDYQKELLEIAYEYIQNGEASEISISTKPNYINRDILKMLKKYKVKCIELEAQSTNNYILGRIKAQYTFEDIKKAARLIKWNGISLGFNMSVGLPDSTKLDDINTAKEIIKLKPKMVKIYPVLVMRNTKLEKDYLEKEYEPLSVVQATERCKELVYMFNEKKVDTIRVGLNNMEKFFEMGNAKIVAGPFHQAFGILVESSIWYDSVVNKIKKLNTKVKVAEIEVNPEDFENVIGYKDENISKLKDTYDVELKVVKNENIKQGKSCIHVLEIYSDFLKEEKKEKDKI